jgi:hypothetical protein
MSGAVEPEDQLEWEARAARPAAISAFVGAACLFIGSFIAPIALASEQPITLGGQLIELDENPAVLLVPAAIQAIGYLVIPVALLYLYKVIKARRPELMTAAKYLAVIGPIIAAIGYVATRLQVLSAATDFAKEKSITEVLPSAGGLATSLPGLIASESRAEDIVTEGNQALTASLQFAGSIGLAFAFLLLGLNGMRSGVLSRFMGILGIVVAALAVFPVFGPPIVAIFWLAAIGVLFLDRWPNGRGPAWETVEQIPWPTQMDKREALIREKQGEEPAEEEYSTNGSGDWDDEAADEPRPQHPSSKKRKRKRRR